MNKIQGGIASVLLIAIFMGTLSVGAVVPSSPSPTPTLQVTSVDISILNVVPGLTFQPGTGEIVTTGIGMTSGFSGGPVNATAGFSFAPVKGFTTINSVLVTIVYFGGTGGYNALGVELNGQAPVDLPAMTVQNTVVGALRNQDLHAGANTISVGIVLNGLSNTGSTFVHQVRLTVEYTFVA
ncbi:hypothetical protein E6H31_02100 [Candidatus Bathyarchaeota archaeon]|nr:MAG: hypothetical protein E6H31_02100 [Candidatus Bathyarchaeota archaeon]